MTGFFACLRRDMSFGKMFVIPACAAAVWIAATESGGIETLARAAASGFGIDYLGVFSIVFKGVPPMEQGGQFVIPLGWIAAMLALSLPSCLYPPHDLGRPRSYQALARTSRASWWWAKIAWSIFSWAIVFITLLACSFLTALVICAQTNVPPSGISDAELIPVLHTALASLCVVVMACVCSLACGSIIGACSTAMFLVASAYFAHPLLFAGYTMFERTTAEIIPLPPWPAAILISIAFCAAIACAGYGAFRRTDYLN